jgi:predicted small lipoprotein YifL
MRRRDGTAGALVLAAALLGLAACGPRGPKAPGREVVTPLLQQEADALKRDGEKLDPVLRVRAIWTVEGIDVTERPNDRDRPWAGAIRFKIRSEAMDADGSIDVHEFERRFDYVYMASLQRWVFQLSPSPAP